MARDIAAERADIDRAIEGKTIPSIFAERAAELADLPALRFRQGGDWQSITWAEYRERVRDVTLGLRALGFARGDFGALMARNRPEHTTADLAILHAGGTPVSLYNTLAPEQVAYVAGHCEARVAFVEDAAFLERFLKVRAELPRLEKVVLFEPSEAAESDWVITFDELVEMGRAEHARDPEAFDRSWRAVEPDDLLTLIYTSGTTGPPKGVMDTHRIVIWTLESFARMKRLDPSYNLISYLPLAHAAERFATHWNGIYSGSVVHFCPDITQLLPTMLEVRPSWFVGVPRVWEKLYAGINAALGAEPDEVKRAAIGRSLEIGREVVAHEQKGVSLPADLQEAWNATRPVREAIAGKVGLDRCEATVTGAAPIATEVIEFFHAIGLRLSEIWGMSELVAPATWNGLDRIKIGTVGYTLPGVECAIADDGELLCRGGNVMAGYYKEPAMTAETLEGGWMHTGDVATVDPDGYFTIVDRKKELIITAGGKNISPANLENLLKQHPLIGQACVIGDRRPYCSALIVLDPEVAPVWAARAGLDARTVAEISARPEVLAEVERHVAWVNERVARVEQIKRFTLLGAEWTAESEELTPTMKLKRRVINQKYADDIDQLYPV